MIILVIWASIIELSETYFSNLKRNRRMSIDALRFVFLWWISIGSLFPLIPVTPILPVLLECEASSDSPSGDLDRFLWWMKNGWFSVWTEIWLFLWKFAMIYGLLLFKLSFFAEVGIFVIKFPLACLLLCRFCILKFWFWFWFF